MIPDDCFKTDQLWFSREPAVAKKMPTHLRRSTHSLTISGKTKKEVALSHETSPSSPTEYTLFVLPKQYFLTGAN